MDLKNSPDVVLELTHEQATFLLENCLSNKRLCLAIIMQIGEEKGTLAEKRKRSERVVRLDEQFGEIMRLLRKSGAKEKEE